MVQHIILVGFRRVGKTYIGQQLAARLNKPFIDENHLDLQRLTESAVISLDDKTALSAENHEIIKSHFVIHVTAALGIVFERLLMSGRPEFFQPDQDLIETFMTLWNERDSVYRRLTTHTICNDQSLEHAVGQAIRCLQRLQLAVDF